MSTPLYVVKALQEVMDSELTDMLDQDSVMMLVHNQRAAEWITKATNKQYIEALQDMEAAGSDDWMGADDDDEDEGDPGNDLDFHGYGHC